MALTDAIKTYQSLTGATLDSKTSMLTVTPAQYANLQTLTFHIGGATYGLTPNAQIWPRSLNAAIGGNSSTIYLVVNDIGHPSGSGFDFCNGYSFLYVILICCTRFSPLRSPFHSQRFYSVFDTANGRIGFAETIYTNSNSN